MYYTLTRTGFDTNGLLSVTDVVLHTAADVSIRYIIQINAGVSIHPWTSIQSPAVEDLISVRGAGRPRRPAGGAADWHVHWANRSWREEHVTVAQLFLNGVNVKIFLNKMHC